MIFWINTAVVTAVTVAFLWRSVLLPKPLDRTAKIAAILIMLFVPLMALGLYAVNGSVDMPDFPARVLPADQQSNEQLLLQERPLIRKLRHDPTQEKLWIALITLYIQTDQMDQARQAYADAIKSVSHPKQLNDPTLRKTLSLPVR